MENREKETEALNKTVNRVKGWLAILLCVLIMAAFAAIIAGLATNIISSHP